MKAVEHMQIYFNLISALPPKLLRLTPKDDSIYEEFRKEFPDLDIDLIQVDALKSDEAKKKWRPFCNMFEGLVEDFNYATMVRLDSKRDYSEDNSIVVPRIQFLAIEIARNREGLNDDIRFKYPPPSKNNDKNINDGSDKEESEKKEESGPSDLKPEVKEETAKSEEQ